MNHLDSIPITQEEMHGRTGKFSRQRCPAKKILCDMKFIMNWVDAKVVSKGGKEATINVASVDQMFRLVADLFLEKERDAQKQWTTVAVSI